MYKYLIFLLTALCFVMASITFADPPVRAGHVHSVGTATTMPPGLNSKGKHPYGLTKKGKVPYGWTQGKKQGWKYKNKRVVPRVVVPAGVVPAAVVPAAVVPAVVRP